MTTRERAARNSEIVRARLRGLGEAEVADRFAVTPRQVRRVLAEHRESRPRLEDIDSAEVVRDALDGYEALSEELALLAERTRHDGVRLGAIKARIEAHKAKIDLLQAAGVLPADLSQLRVLRDVEKLADTIMFVFDDEGCQSARNGGSPMSSRAERRSRRGRNIRPRTVTGADERRPGRVVQRANCALPGPFRQFPWFRWSNCDGYSRSPAASRASW